MKKVKVLKDLCIGCGACQAICSEVYEIGEDGLAEVKVDEIKEDVLEDALDALDALENCPTGAIVEDPEEND